MYRVAVWGASGMAGGEILRLLAGHSQMEVVLAVSRGEPGKPVWPVHPHLRQDYPELVFTDPERALSQEMDLAFLALPHGESWPVIRAYRERGVKVMDLSADVRLRTSADYEKWYGSPHGDPDLLDAAVYGLPELHREELRGADLASGVGCNATCAILGLYPLAREGLIEDARLELRVGSSEGGARPSRGGHHPYRSRTLRVYEPFRHRHLAEILQELTLSEESVTMAITAVEMVRGVQMMGQLVLSRRVREAELWKAYRNAYSGEPFVFLSPARPPHLRLPDPRLVLGSNRALVGFSLHPDGRRLVVVSAIDNLMKGASGTAIQSANLLLGLEETMGLTMRPVYPA